MVDYGRDIWGTTDTIPTMPDVTSDDIMPQVICHRLLCDPGSLLSAPDAQTINLFSYLSSGIPRDRRGLDSIRGAISGALADEPRIYTSAVQVRFDEDTETLSVSVSGEGATGPFRLTLAVSETSVQVLNQ
jgi:hypothetical protein